MYKYFLLTLTTCVFTILLFLTGFVFLSRIPFPSVTIEYEPKTETIEASTEGPEEILNGIYARDVFRSKDTEIQTFFFKDFKNTAVVELKVDSYWVPFHSHCYYPICTGVQGGCSFMDYFAQAAIPANFSEEVAVLRVAGFQREHVFRIIDARSDGEYEHELAVVLQPGYYVADWQNMIQYFESWKAHGATKFYVYHYSWTQQVQKVVDFYQQQLGSALEVLPWSAVPVLPQEEGLYDSDPNTHFFNLISESSLNNALYRSKKTVKYLAMTDLDEIVGVNYGFPLIGMLDNLTEQFEMAGEFRFKWGQYMTQVPLVKYDRPSETNFDYLKSIEKLSLTSMHSGYYTNNKCIHRPDRLILVDTHNSIALENSFNDTRFETVIVNKTDAMVIHLRRIFDGGLEVDTVSKDRILEEHANHMETSFFSAINGTNFAETMMSPWLSEYKSVLLTLHDCRRLPGRHYETEDKEGLSRCRSVRGCEQFIAGKDSFVFAQSTWTNLAEPTRILENIYKSNDTTSSS